MAQAQPDPIDEVTALLSRGAAAARRVLSGPDGPLALALLLAMTATAEATLYTEEIEPALLTNLFATLPLALVRKRLAWATATIVLAVSVALGEQSLTISGLLAVLIVLYLSASRYRRRWCVLLAFPFFVNAVSPYSGEEPGFANVLLLFVVVAALALGDSRRERGRAIAERDETRRAMQDTLEDQAAMGERARIARDLHDIVAHHVSAIAVEAETARLTTRRLPKEAGAHFEAIAQTARDALDEMRRLLGVLREDANGELGRAPQPGLAQLDELIETARAAGSTVRLTMSGEAATLPPGVDLCAYRIVQEALSNARRHAPGATVDVEIAYSPDSLALRVKDDGPGSADGDLDGHGLLGMRERATIAGGTLRAGPPSKAASRSRRSCRCRRHDDPRRRRGRPGDRPGRLRRAARDAGRHQRRRHRRRRRGGRARERRGASRRGADGHPHADARRHRGDQTARRGRRHPAEGDRAHDLRPRRVRLRRARRRRQRLPTQGRRRPRRCSRPFASWRRARRCWPRPSRAGW